MILDELSLEQRHAASHTGGPLLVKGLAGTGKSTVVAARAAMLLDSGVPEEKVVLISRTGSAEVPAINRSPCSLCSTWNMPSPPSGSVCSMWNVPSPSSGSECSTWNDDRPMN